MLIKRVKGKTTRKGVNNSLFRGKFRVEGVKRREYFIILVVHVNNQPLDDFTLVFYKKAKRELMW